MSPLRCQESGDSAKTTKATPSLAARGLLSVTQSILNRSGSPPRYQRGRIVAAIREAQYQARWEVPIAQLHVGNHGTVTQECKRFANVISVAREIGRIAILAPFAQIANALFRGREWIQRDFLTAACRKYRRLEFAISGHTVSPPSFSVAGR